MKNQLKYISLALVVSLIVFSGCHKDKTPASTGILWLHLHTNVDTNEVDSYGDVYPDANGRNMSLDIAQFYISSVSIQSTSGTWTDVPVYIIKTLDQEEFMVGNVPAGSYNDIKFTVGVNSADNSTTPTSHASSTASDSVLNHPEMWFGNTTQGYVFLNVQGMVDTNNSGTPNGAFSYKIGSTALTQTVTLPQEAFTVTPNQIHYVHITCDYGRLLQGIDMSNPANRTTDTYTTNTSTATTVSNAIQNMFRYEE